MKEEFGDKNFLLKERLKLTRGHNPRKNQSSVISVNDPLQVMGTSNERFHQNSMKTARGVEETKHTGS